MKKNAYLNMWFLISLILIHVTSQNFLQFDTKINCPKIPMSSLGLLISLAESDEGYNYESKLSEEERKPYQEIVYLKRSFSSTMSRILGRIKPFDVNFHNHSNFPYHFYNILYYCKIYM